MSFYGKGRYFVYARNVRVRIAEESPGRWRADYARTGHGMKNSVYGQVFGSSRKELIRKMRTEISAHMNPEVHSKMNPLSFARLTEGMVSLGVHTEMATQAAKAFANETERKREKNMNKFLIIALAATAITLSGFVQRERWYGSMVYEEAYWNRESRLIEACQDMKTEDVQKKAAEPFHADPKDFSCSCGVDFDGFVKELRVKYQCYGQKTKKKIDVIYRIGVTSYVNSAYE